MDDRWERAIPLYALDWNAVSLLFGACAPNVRPLGMRPLTEGKRTSNYRVHTEAGDYILRIFPPADESWRREASLRDKLPDRVPMQRLCHVGRHEAIGGRAFAIYEFARGRTLLEAALSGYVPDEALSAQLGEAAAAIHSVRYAAVGWLDDALEIGQPMTPLSSWYGYFLTDTVRGRMEVGMADRIVRLTELYDDALRELDGQASLVHGDFRPTNLLVDEGRLSCVLDWEFAMAGHALADVGQLFRYPDLFPAASRAAFAQAYESASGLLLPPGWERLAMLRDLVNLLQMLGPEEEQPIKYGDLNRLIMNTVRTLESEGSA